MNMSRTQALWMAALVVVALVVVGPAILPLEETPDVTSTVAPPGPSTTRATAASTTTTETAEAASEGPAWRWTRMDPDTLEDAASSPLLLGAPGRTVFSPDGRTVASFLYSASDNSEELVIADLEQWRVRSRLPLEGWVVNDQSGVVEGPLQATFLTGGDVLTWISQLPAEYGSGPVAEDYALFRHKLGENQPELIYRFPAGFAPWETRLLTADRLAVFGSPVVFDDETPDDARWPRLLVVDARTGRVEWEVPMPGLIAGHPWKGDQGTSFVHPGLGWDLAGERLYIAHADRSAVTTVDLSRGEVIGESEISRPTSIRQKLMQWLLPPARAKLEESTRLNARVDPGGERLYLSGVRWELVHNDKGNAVNDRQVALGLTVLELPTLETVTHVDLPVSDVEISADGSLLLLTGVWDGRVVDSNPEQSGLYVLEAATLEERGHLWPGTIPWIHGYSDDGSSVYVTVWDQRANLLLLDLLELDTLAERALANGEETSFELPHRGFTATWAGG